jgi:cytochrome b
LSEKIVVWDFLIRVLHWSLAIGITIAWLTEDGPSLLHDGARYAVLVIIAIRLIWGVLGSKFARFHSFIKRPSTTLDYAKTVARGAAPRHLGHNPLGGWMIITLLTCTALTGLTGWLYTTDTFWGLEWMEEIHEAFASLILILVPLHVAGVIFTSIRQRENLVKSMIYGQKEKRPGDV